MNQTQTIKIHKQHLYKTIFANIPIGQPYYLRQNEKEIILIKTPPGQDTNNQPFNSIRIQDGQLIETHQTQPIDPIEIDITYRQTTKTR